MRRPFVACMLVALVGCGADAPPAAPANARLDQYRAVKERARAWIDALEVDSVALTARGVKGKKKLGEILETYAHFRNATDDPAERAAIQDRVTQLVRQTERSEYHNMATAPDTEFNQNSMSYFRVLTLMGEFGLPTAAYLDELRKVKPRMDGHLGRRGRWQRAMFRKYYMEHGLELPPVLADLTEATGVVAKRLPATQISMTDGYRLTHQVFVAFEYGHRKTQDHLGPEDVSYLETVLPRLLRLTREARQPDLLAEYLSCMTYFGWQDDTEYRAAVDYLLANQNPTGTWGNYEQYRPQFGDYVDQHLYLHTTMVAMRALIEAFESDWN